MLLKAVIRLVRGHGWMTRVTCVMSLLMLVLVMLVLLLVLVLLLMIVRTIGIGIILIFTLVILPIGVLLVYRVIVLGRGGLVVGILILLVSSIVIRGRRGIIRVRVGLIPTIVITIAKLIVRAAIVSSILAKRVSVTGTASKLVKREPSTTTTAAGIPAVAKSKCLERVHETAEHPCTVVSVVVDVVVAQDSIECGAGA